MPDPAPARLQKIRHGARRGRAINRPVGDQASGEPVGADGRLARPHPRPGAPAEVFERTDCRVLHPRLDVPWANHLALTQQWLEGELLAVRLGDPELGRTVAELVQLVYAVIQRHL